MCWLWFGGVVAPDRAVSIAVHGDPGFDVGEDALLHEDLCGVVLVPDGRPLWLDLTRRAAGAALWRVQRQ
jgi:hypothetical protein